VDWNFHDAVTTSGHHYSRAVVDTLFPLVVSPLTTDVVNRFRETLTTLYAEAGVSEAEPLATFGGRVFLNTTLLGRFARRVSGADPLTFVGQYTGTRQGPSRQEPAAPPAAAAFARWVREFSGGALEASPVPDRGPLSRASDADLVERVAEVQESVSSAVDAYTRAELVFGVAVELVTRTAGRAGVRTFPAELIGGAGPGASTLVAELWRIGRLATRSDNLATLLPDRRADTVRGITSPAADDCRRNGEFVEAIRSFLRGHQHGGASGLELASETWGTSPDLLLDVLTVLGAAADGSDPTHRTESQRAISNQRVQQIRQALPPSSDESALFERCLAAALNSCTARGVLLDRLARTQHALRLVARELGRRYQNRGDLDCAAQIFMLHGHELSRLLDHPDHFSELARMRSYDYHALARRCAPYTTVDCPSQAVKWPSRAGRAKAPRRWSGVLAGTPTGVNVVSGRTQTLHRPGPRSRPDAGKLLVTYSGERAWVPFLSGMSGVVMDYGGALTDVALACRDLKVPCLTSAAHAMSKIPADSVVALDESTGTVRSFGADEPATQRSRDPLPERRPACG
jgi:rifampicin phosphotransferase